MIGPIVEEVASELGDGTRVGKLNVDDHNEIPGKFGIRGIPTLMMFKNGQVIGTKVGAVSKAQLLEFINEHQ
jgi:thioredoxin 1